MKKKLISLAVVVCLLAVAVVGGTLAFFTDKAEVTNTFTAGKVDITLDEAPVDKDGQATAGDRVAKNTYKLYPGKEYDKDPTITVAADSEDCYLFVNVVNGLDGHEAEGATTIAAQMADNGWTLVDGETDVYMQANTYSANAEVAVFEKFTIADNETATTLATVEDVVVTAYAVQAEGFTSAQAAWDATFGTPVEP